MTWASSCPPGFWEPTRRCHGGRTADDAASAILDRDSDRGELGVADITKRRRETERMCHRAVGVGRQAERRWDRSAQCGQPSKAGTLPADTGAAVAVVVEPNQEIAVPVHPRPHPVAVTPIIDDRRAIPGALPTRRTVTTAWTGMGGSAS